MTIIRFATRSALVAGLSLAPGTVWALDTFTLENIRLEGRDIVAQLPRVVFTDTNVSKDDAAKLFSAATPRDQQTAIIARLEAARIEIPEAQVSGKNGGAVARPFVVLGVDKGKFRKLDFAGLEGTFVVPDVGEGNVKIRPLAIEDADYTGLLNAVRTGDATGVSGRLARLTWAGFEASFPDKETAKDAPGGNLVRVDLANVEHTGTYDGDTPLKGNFALRNLVIAPPQASRFGKQLKDFGYDKLDLGMTASGAYDPSAKSYVLDEMTLSGANMGSLGLKGTFVGLEKIAFNGAGTARLGALTNGEVASMGVKLINNGIVDKAIAYFGRTQKKSPDQVKREFAGIVTGLAPTFLGGSEASQKIAAAIAKFVANPASLALAMTARGTPVRFAELWGIRDPQGFLARMDIDAIANQ